MTYKIKRRFFNQNKVQNKKNAPTKRLERF